jgi:predicted adenylyl cyclase CyaB
MKVNQIAAHHSNDLEVEVKLEVRNARKIRRQFRALGFTEVISRAFENNWILDFSDRRLVQSSSLLRIRQYSGSTLLTFKRPRLGSRRFKVLEELETEVTSASTLHKILGRLGFTTTFRYQKFRSVFRKVKGRGYTGPILALDETRIGTYVEIEGTKKQIDLLAKELGYSRSDYITDSYPQLFLRKRRKARKVRMIFPARNEKNP